MGVFFNNPSRTDLIPSFLTWYFEPKFLWIPPKNLPIFMTTDLYAYPCYESRSWSSPTSSFNKNFNMSSLSPANDSSVFSLLGETWFSLCDWILILSVGYLPHPSYLSNLSFRICTSQPASCHIDWIPNDPKILSFLVPTREILLTSKFLRKCWSSLGQKNLFYYFISFLILSHNCCMRLSFNEGSLSSSQDG